MTDVFQIRYVSKIKYVAKIYSNIFEGDIEQKKKEKQSQINLKSIEKL